MNYQTALQSWHDFYAITGEGAASLVGLLFVGLSLQLRLVVSRPDVRALARVTLTNFICTLALSLFMAIPESAPAKTGIELLSLGLITCLFIAPNVARGVRSHVQTISLWHLVLRFGFSGLAFLGASACGVMLIAGDYQDALTGLVIVTLAVLVISLRNCWDLLVSVEAAGLSTKVVDRA